MNRLEQFIRERRFLYNALPATVSWCSHAFKNGWLRNRHTYKRN
jgi:hypothetical protein